jgi:hypothetical protein
LTLYTGERVSDVARMAWVDVRDGTIRVTPLKTRRSTRVKLVIPLLPELVEALRHWPKEHVTILTCPAGKPFTAQGLAAWMASEGCCAYLRCSRLLGKRDPVDHRPCFPVRGRTLYERSRSEAACGFGGGTAGETQAKHVLPNLIEVWEGWAFLSFQITWLGNAVLFM